MTYRLEKIEGIGAHFATLLANASVSTTKDLLRHAKSDGGLTRLAERTGIPLASLEVWAARADLMRVQGIGPQFSELLEASGVESVAELSMRNAENLLNLLHRVNEQKQLTRSIPTLRRLTQWVMRAQDMVPHDKALAAPPKPAAASTPATPVAPFVPRQPVTGSGAALGQRSGAFQVAGSGSGPYHQG